MDKTDWGIKRINSSSLNRLMRNKRNTKRHSSLRFIPVLCILSLFQNIQSQEIWSRWTFDDADPNKALETISGKEDALHGFLDRISGVKGSAVRFDGYTSYLERTPFGMELPDRFTINAWIVLECYPWFRSPVFDLRGDLEEGMFLSVNREGILTAGLGRPNDWGELSGETLPLNQWIMVSLAVSRGRTARLYINGEMVDEIQECPGLRKTGNYTFTAARNSILEEWWDFQYTTTDQYSFLDGCIDELTVYKQDLDEERLKKIHQSCFPIPEFKPEKRVLPGPSGQGSGFGAVYTRLNYTKKWDRLWRVGDYPDIEVNFADHDCRLVFWRGTSFVPCWVTENGIWYTNEWAETWGSDVVSCAEPLMDRQCRHSHVRILENSPARTVIHWRYGLVDTEYTFVAKDIDGRGEWADEYYIIYPDGIGIRKIDLYYSKPLRKHDWEESIVLLSPGQHPDDVMNDPEITLMNISGESRRYSWRQNLPVVLTEPEKANIHVVNLKSEYKPFYIVTPEAFESVEGRYDSPFFRSYSAAQAENYRPDTVPSIYGWWDHWPVAQVPGDGRWVINGDRASHFNLTTFTQWKDYHMDDRIKSRIMLHGMTNGDDNDLVMLAKSWLKPPELLSTDCRCDYNPAERAFDLTGIKNQIIHARFHAGRDRPAVRPALVLNDSAWGNPAVLIDGRELKPGIEFRHGIVKETGVVKTILWLDMTILENVDLVIRQHGMGNR